MKLMEEREKREVDDFVKAHRSLSKQLTTHKPMSDFELAVDLLLSAGGCGGGGGKPPKRRRTARSNAGRRGYHCCRKGRGCRGGPASLIRYVAFEGKFFCGECISELGYDRIPGAVAQASPNQHAATSHSPRYSHTTVNTPGRPKPSAAWL